MAFTQYTNHATNQAAESDLINQLVAGSATPNTALSFSDGILYSVLANLVASLRRYTATLSPSIVAANTSAEQTFTVTGVTTGDVVVVNKPTAQAGLGIVGVRVTAADTVGITFMNATGSGITPTASQVYTFIAYRVA